MDTSTTWHTCSGCTLKAHCRGAWWDESHAAYRRDLGEEIEIKTWVENVRRVRSLRKYEFIRKSDGKVLVKGETDWVFVDAKKGTPRAIPEEVSKIFAITQDKSL